MFCNILLQTERCGGYLSIGRRKDGLHLQQEASRRTPPARQIYPIWASRRLCLFGVRGMCEGISSFLPPWQKNTTVQYKIIYFSDQDIVGNL